MFWVPPGLRDSHNSESGKVQDSLWKEIQDTFYYHQHLKKRGGGEDTPGEAVPRDRNPGSWRWVSGSGEGACISGSHLRHPPPTPAPNRLCPDQTPGRQGGVERAEVHAGAAGRGGPAPAPEEIRDPAMLSQKEEIKDPVSRSKETAQER